jgi:hypothetical protein
MKYAYKILARSLEWKKPWGEVRTDWMKMNLKEMRRENVDCI